MTCIIRKNNQLLTDSLIFNARSCVVSVEQQNKILRNKAGTACICFIGNEFSGKTNEALDHLSNLIVNKELLNEDFVEGMIPKHITDILSQLILEDAAFVVVIFTKKATYVLKTYTEKFELYTHKLTNDVLYFGSGSSYLMSKKVNEYSCMIQLMKETIQAVSTCIGPINVFDLNLLRDIQ